MMFSSKNRSLLAGIVALAATLALAGPAAAQVATATIDVTVMDSAGASLPGVTVTVVNRDTGLDRIQVTDEAGLARFPALPPGPYDVSGELSGFAAAEQAEVVVRVGQTARLTFTLTPEISESMTVAARTPVVDLYRTDTSTNIVPEQIEELPVADRDFQRLAFIAPGVQRERGSFRFIQGGPVIGSSGNASQSTILVDGVDFTDQALGLARTRFSQDAIQEFRVITNRFDTEVGGSAGGALSILTRSGTNQLKGSVFGFYRDDSLRSTGALETGSSDFNRGQYGFTLGGPITQDRTHYFLSAEYIDEQNVSLFRPGGAYAGRAADVDHPFEQLLGLGSVDHRFSDSNTLSGKVVYERYREDNFRVGGVNDVSNGQRLERDNWNVSATDTWVLSGTRLNELRLQLGARKYFEPTNSDAVEEWFSSGNTLRTGANTVGDLLGDGDYWEIRDTFHQQLSTGNSTHDLKAGFSAYRVEERSDIPVFQEGLLIYVTDDRTLPLAYAYGVGSADVTVDTSIYSVFVQDDWRALPNLTVSLGLRYDYDTDGNNPDFQHPLVGDRSADDDNIQPRVGFSWDVTGEGKDVVRGGAGIFTGRYLLVPSFTELQQNGVSGRVVRQNVNGLFFGLPPAFWLDPNNPENTGIPLNPDISLLDDSLEAPESTQASLGYTRRLGSSGLFLDVEGIYAEGDNEIIIRDGNFGGNANPVRLNPAYNQINMYTNEGRSEYKALVLGLNGTLRGGHLIASSVTFADKKNIADDFSPAFPVGYPSDPANIDAEYGNSRGVEDYRIVLSGVFRLPWQISVAPIYEYGSGQPWNRRLGYDFNGDGKASDRAPGVERNSEDGPDFKQFSLRITKGFQLGEGRLDLIVEGFNLFDNTNYDVSSVDGAEFLAGPTLANPGAAFVANPNFGTYRATLPPREVQIGLRYRW